MQISEATIEILRNCAKLSNHLVVDVGNVITTLTPKRNRLLQATVKEHFDVPFALHDLSGFLRQLSLFDEPNINFLDNKMVITDKYKTMSEYYYSDKDDLVYLSQQLRPSEDVATFSLSNIAFDKIIRASGANGTEDISFKSVDGGVSIIALDKDKPKRVFSVDLGECSNSFCMYIKHTKKNKLQLMPLDYIVSISNTKILKFSSEFDGTKILYYVAAEVDSIIGE